VSAIQPGPDHAGQVNVTHPEHQGKVKNAARRAEQTGMTSSPELVLVPEAGGLSVHEAAAYTGVSPDLIVDAVRSGQLTTLPDAPGASGAQRTLPRRAVEVWWLQRALAR
jgi:rhamnose utilization protein RhaD (predicted bifunctional aldolase and dehydrogenase)